MIIIVFTCGAVFVVLTVYCSHTQCSESPTALQGSHKIDAAWWVFFPTVEQDNSG